MRKRCGIDLAPRLGIRGADPDEQADASGGSIIPDEKLRLPIVLRLARQGDTITARYSTDEGKTFQAAGEPLTFESPLPKTVYAGLAITAHDASQTSEAKFDGLKIEPR